VQVGYGRDTRPEVDFSWAAAQPAGGRGAWRLSPRRPAAATTSPLSTGTLETSRRQRSLVAHTYAEAGDYQVTLTVPNPCGDVVVIKTVRVTEEGSCVWTDSFFDDFEGSLGSWTLTGLWHDELDEDVCGSLVAPFPSPVHDAYYGQAGTCTFDTGARTSAAWRWPRPGPERRPAGRPPVLELRRDRVWHRQGCRLRQATVEVSTDGGQTWTEIARLQTEGQWYSPWLGLTPTWARRCGCGSPLTRWIRKGTPSSAGCWTTCACASACPTPTATACPMPRTTARDLQPGPADADGDGLGDVCDNQPPTVSCRCREAPKPPGPVAPRSPSR